MDVPKGFYFPPGATAEAARIAGTAIYSSPNYESLYPYMGILDTECQWEKPPQVYFNELNKTNYIIGRAARAFSFDFTPLRRCWTVDILMIGECGLPSTIKMMIRLLKGIIDRGLSVLYLVSFGSEEFQELSSFVKRQGIEKQIHFLDPYGRRTFFCRWMQHAKIIYQAYCDWQVIQSKLNHSKIYLSERSYKSALEVAEAKIVWERLEPYIKFKMLIARSHWTPLCIAVTMECQAKGKPVVSFQHGVVSCWATHVPLLASRFICFGKATQQLLTRMDQKISQVTGRARLCQEIIPLGSLYDDIFVFESNREKKTLLIIDQGSQWALKMYGIANGNNILRSLVRDIAAHSEAVQKIIVRPHPLEPNFWDMTDLVKENPERIEISNPSSFSLTFDLSRSSIAVGLFSAALATAAASGIPAFFLWEPKWFFTPDLSCFAEFFLSARMIINQVNRLMTHDDEYKIVQKKAKDAASLYYLNGKVCTFEPPVIDQILASV